MYMQLPSPKQKCSVCGVIDQTEMVTKSTTGGTITYIRCAVCGHSKEISRTTWYPPDNMGRDYTYTIPEQPEIEDF